MHSLHHIHRDIKFENLFVDANEDLFLGDLGIAQNTTIKLAQTVIGTPETMAPEVFLNKPYNERADVWSLGCVCYELLSGRKPFQAPTQYMLQDSIKKGQFGKLNGGWFESTCMSMMELNPMKRPSSAFLLSQAAMFIPQAQCKTMTLRVPTYGNAAQFVDDGEIVQCDKCGGYLTFAEDLPFH